MCGPQNEGRELHLKQTQGNQPYAPDLYLSKEKCIAALISQKTRTLSLLPNVATFQSHEPEFDYLKSLEIEEKINKIKWLPQQNAAHSLLSTNGEAWRWGQPDLTQASCFLCGFSDETLQKTEDPYRRPCLKPLNPSHAYTVVSFDC